MVNIFLILLSVLFMAGYYLISSPSQRTINQETEYAIKNAELRSVAECVVSAQNAVMYGEDFTDTCLERYDIKSQYICMNAKYNIMECDSETGKPPVYNFIITSSSALPEQEYNRMLEVLERYYPEAGMFGIFVKPELISAGSVTRRKIPNKIIDKADLSDGQLVYIMQYTIPEEPIDYPTVDGSNLICPDGTMKTYRFGRWQCIGYNYRTSCTGDTIWDSTLLECVADETRKPLCANNQTAVMIDDIWECVDPFADKECPAGMVARLNYTDLVWECTEDPNTAKVVKKCDNITRIHKSHTNSGVGATLRVRSISCTDCEQVFVDEETCETFCIPDISKLNDPKCYAGNVSECSGPTRGIYFGFNQKSRIDGIDTLKQATVFLDKNHSQNRMFNCMDCGEGEIDTENSIYPYTAVCK